MLWPAHFNLFAYSLLDFDPVVNDNTIDLTIQGQHIILSLADYNDLVKGLFYPDLPCGYFYIEDKQIRMDLRLCFGLNILTVGHFTNEYIRSQTEDSHNGVFAINHSMANDKNMTNEDTQNEILRRCITLAYLFLNTHNYAFLGYILHIVQDSWAPGHTYREHCNKTSNIVGKLPYIINKLNKKTVTEEYFHISEPITAKHVTDCLFFALEKQQNIAKILQIVSDTSNNDKTMMNYSPIMNEIIVMLLQTPKLCSCDKDQKHVNIDFINRILSVGILEKSALSNINDNYVENSFFTSSLKYDDILTDLQKNTLKLFKDNVTYDKFNTNMTRLYKLCMNSILTYDVFQSIASLLTGTIEAPTQQIIPEDVNRMYIKHFLYYLDQDSKLHAAKDCETVLTTTYQRTKIFDYAIKDTSEIIKILLNGIHQMNDANKNDILRTTIEQFYNFLVNYTLYIAEENKNLSFNKTNVDDVDKITAYDTVVGKSAISCLAQNGELFTANFSPTIEKLKSSIAHRSLQLKGGYEYKCAKYKSKCAKLQKKINEI